jgi:hypothetical protein
MASTPNPYANPSPRLQELEARDRETGLSPEEQAMYSGYRTVLAYLDQQVDQGRVSKCYN